MGCSFSGLNAIYGAAGGTGDVWVNDNRFRILKQIGGTDVSSTVFLVKENLPDGATGGLAKKKSIDPSHISADGTYAMKKFMIHSKEQLELVKQEIRVSSQFNHPNLLPLLDHAIISVKGKEDGIQNYEAYLLFPVHLDGTLSELTKIMQAKNEYFPTITVLQIFRQLCAGLKHMHSFDPPHAHNDVRPENVLITQRKEQAPLAMLMDFESARPARRSIRSQSEASQLQEWAAEHCSALYRAPELWDVPSNTDIDERTDVWSLGCTLYAIMYGKSPFDYEIDESEGGLKSAVKSAQIKWSEGPNPAYPDLLRQFITWMLQPQPAIRPTIDDIIIHVDKLIVKYSS
ncbi:Serine/threonine-protein kinase 16 [Rhynchospora pubera]|uniref:Serine/threonine-protein kinase 16 n=1 Tax=Rhynchospora pubera TaxID=906938 RepID=A0AAV8FES8_9POAL|nr:Serine/threonine-protein kinase 16 [Rhynchospora pubera]